MVVSRNAKTRRVIRWLFDFWLGWMHATGVVRVVWRGFEQPLSPGAVFIANHPFLGAMHTPDINIIAPVFVEGRLFAWTGTTAHHLDHVLWDRGQGPHFKARPRHRARSVFY